MTIGEKIKIARQKAGLSVDELAAAIGKDRSTIYRYEGKEIKKIPTSVLMPLCKALNVSPSYFMGWESDALLNAQNILPLPKTKKIPLLGTIACGKPILATENIEDEIDVPSNIKADFALLCKGDSMINAFIKNGDIVYVKIQPDVYNGEIAAVLIDDEATLKRVYKSNNQVILQAENPKFEPMIFTESDGLKIKILGKAVGFTSKL